MKNVIYLDNNATTAPLKSVTEAVQFAMNTIWGNPSSIHKIGQEARYQVDLARASVAKLIHAMPNEIIFTSGGTEAANVAIHTACNACPERKVIVTSKIEHAAVGEMLDQYEKESYEIIRLQNCDDGIVCIEELEKLLHLRASEIALVSIMWCNNETGVIEPIEDIVRLCHAHDVLVHSDGTQWVAKMPVNIKDTSVDLLSFASHKFHGPKGVGALYAKDGLQINPLVTGGPQEQGRRGGTENVPSILGFGVAATEASDWLTNENIASMKSLQSTFERKLQKRLPQVHINSSGANRAWTTTSVSFPDIKGELMLLMLSERGVCASSGSACSSGALKGSKVIEAIGSPDDREWGSVRFSFARTTTPEEINQAIDAIVDSLESISKVIAFAQP